jgi:hypothetical protein
MNRSLLFIGFLILGCSEGPRPVPLNHSAAQAAEDAKNAEAKPANGEKTGTSQEKTPSPGGDVAGTKPTDTMDPVITKPIDPPVVPDKPKEEISLTLWQVRVVIRMLLKNSANTLKRM